MNTRLLAFLATVGAFLTALGGADLSGLITLLPDQWAKGLVTVLPLGAAIVHFINIFGDAADDGKVNGSWKVKLVPIVMWLTLGTLALGFTACTGLSLSVTPGGRVVGEYQLPPPKAAPIVQPAK